MNLGLMTVSILPSWVWISNLVFEILFYFERFLIFRGEDCGGCQE